VETCRRLPESRESEVSARQTEPFVVVGEIIAYFSGWASHMRRSKANSFPRLCHLYQNPLSNTDHAGRNCEATEKVKITYGRSEKLQPDGPAGRKASIGRSTQMEPGVVYELVDGYQCLGQWLAQRRNKSICCVSTMAWCGGRSQVLPSRFFGIDV
jgi:hypothetical protein